MDQRELRRVRTTFGRYARDPARQRAWNAANPGNRAIRREVVDRAFELAGDDLLGGDVLDIGCGSGWWLGSIQTRGAPAARLHGVDLLAGRTDAARRKLPGATVLEADARALPFEDGRFAAVTLFLVLSSLAGREDMRSVLREARRVAVRGGAVVVWEPRVRNPRNRVTHHVDRGLLEATLGMRAATRTLTVLPPLARRLRATRRTVGSPGCRRCGRIACRSSAHDLGSSSDPPAARADVLSRTLVGIRATAPQSHDPGLRDPLPRALARARHGRGEPDADPAPRRRSTSTLGASNGPHRSRLRRALHVVLPLAHGGSRRDPAVAEARLRGRAALRDADAHRPRARRRRRGAGADRRVPRDAPRRAGRPSRAAMGRSGAPARTATRGSPG